MMFGQNWLKKNAKICRLEAELSTLRANCRASKELLTEKCEDVCVEIENIHKNFEKLSVEQKRLKVNIEQLRKANLNKVTVKTKNNSQVIPKGTTGTDKITEKLQSNTASVNDNSKQVFDRTKTPVVDVVGEHSITINLNADSSNSINSKPSINNNVNECQKNNAEINIGVRKNDMNLLNSNLPVNQDDSSNEFVGVERRRTKRIYLGGVKDCVESETIKHFMEDKGIYP